MRLQLAILALPSGWILTGALACGSEDDPAGAVAGVDSGTAAAASDGSAEAAHEAGDAGAGCGALRKECGGACVDVDDPAFGCAGSGCAPCSIANGTATCEAGQCAVESCAAGFADCNGDADDGCEAELASDLRNCSRCGHDCRAGGPGLDWSCSSGACAPASCPPATANCDGKGENGCEVTVSSNVLHCGGCGKACNATNGMPSCTNGTCSIVCSAGFDDCDRDAATGCESALDAQDHCGGCANVCGAGFACDTTSLICVCVDSCYCGGC